MKKTWILATSLLAMLPAPFVHATDGTPPTIQAPFQTTAPVMDGAIGTGEYAFDLFVSFAGGVGSNTNPGEVHPDLTTGWSGTDADASVTLYLGHDATNLYLGFEVTDDFIDNSASDEGVSFVNDSIGIAINGDGANNDYLPFVESSLADGPEGFRYVVDAANQVFMSPNAFVGQNRDGLGGDGTHGGAGMEADDGSGTGGPLADILSATSLPSAGAGTGYTIEIVVPLASIDTQDGAGFTAATTGDTLKFDFELGDNDADSSAQDAFLMFWNTSNLSTFQGGEPAWEVDLELTAATGQPGDFDDDLDVDGADFLAWQRGESPNGATAGDLAEWEANYGTPAPLAAAVGAVPEPTSFVLVCLGLVGMLGVSRRKK